MKQNFILDYESFSQNKENCALVNCAYFLFDWDRFTTNDPYTMEELLDTIVVDKFELDDQKYTYGFKTQKDTIQWWMDQDEEVKKQALPSKDDITLLTYVANLAKYLGSVKVNQWWSRGNEFDPRILERILVATGQPDLLKNNLPYWALRDTRSFLDGAIMYEVRNDFIPMEDENKWNSTFKKHVSKHDIMADILRLQLVVRMRKGLGYGK